MGYFGRIRRASGRRRVRSHMQVFFPVPPSLPSPQRRLARVPAGAEPTSSPRRAHAEPTSSRIAERRDHFSEFRALRFRIFFSMPFWIDFRSIFARFCFSTWLQKLTEIAKRSMPRCIPSWAHFFDRFSVGFCSQLPSKNPEKSCPRCSGSTTFEKSPFKVNIDF